MHPPYTFWGLFAFSLLLSRLDLSDTESESLKLEPASEPLHIFVLGVRVYDRNLGEAWPAAAPWLIPTRRH